jgi:hypothetical protein
LPAAAEGGLVSTGLARCLALASVSPSEGETGADDNDACLVSGRLRDLSVW